MRDDEQTRSPPQNTFEALLQSLRVERCKALVQNQKLRSLKNGAGDEHSASLPMRELPACIADHLRQSRRHSLQ